ncbi:PTS sugar transporter subunit IIA [candidate division KSB1 bacterium]|nr:PTS sugar transporter subunit IIA [candidate division KSB1 bacterium]
MALNQFFSASFILHQIEIQDQNELFLKFTEKAYTTNLIADREKFQETLVQQELQNPSGLEQGVALPHIRSALIRKTFMMLATLKTPLDFKTLDASPVNIVVLLCAPPHEEQSYIQLLARITRLLINESNRQAILNAIGPNAAFQIIDTHGNWDIVIDKSERYLMNLILYREELLDEAIQCLIESGLFQAQILTGIPLKYYLNQKFTLLAKGEAKAKYEFSSSKIITGIVSDHEILRKFSQLLKNHHIDLEEPGVGVLTLTRIEDLVGGVAETLNI